MVFKTILYFFISLFTTIGSTRGYNLNHVDQTKTFLQQNNDTVFMQCYSYGGTVDLWNNSDSDRRFIVQDNNYCLNYVFFNGDIFCPYLLGEGYIEWGDDLLDETEEMFEELHLSKFECNGVNCFKVGASGTYVFSLSLSTSISSSNLSKIWDVSSISFDPSIDRDSPQGNFDIFLHGAYDGSSFSKINSNAKKISFDSTTNCYILEVGLYEGDIFCPFLNNSNAYIYSLNDKYSNTMLEKNYLDTDSNGYFVCLQTGTFLISISYRVEYFINLSFLWSIDGGSSITYISQSIIEEKCTGLEEILFVGTANGEQQYNTNSKYIFSFNASKKVYEISIYLKSGDYFIFFLKKKDLYVNGNALTDYARQMMKISGLTTYMSSNRTYFLAEKSGLYYFAFDGSIENIYNPNEVWKNHSKSVIRFLGNSSNCMFFLSSDLKAKTLSTSNNENDICQFYNYKLSSNVLTRFGNDSLNIYKVEYDNNFSTNYSLTIHDQMTNKKIDGILTDGASLLLDSQTISNSNGKALGFLSFLDETINYTIQDDYYIPNNIYQIGIGTLHSIVSRYDSLNSEEKTLVDCSTIKINKGGEIIEEKVLTFIGEVNTILYKSVDNSLFPIYLVVIIVIDLEIIYFVLCFKKHRRDEYE